MNKINLIAEIGWNHMGNMSLAKKMIFEAKKNGANICKFKQSHIWSTPRAVSSKKSYSRCWKIK